MKRTRHLPTKTEYARFLTDHPDTSLPEYPCYACRHRKTDRANFGFWLQHDRRPVFDSRFAKMLLDADERATVLAHAAKPHVEDTSTPSHEGYHYR